MAYGVGRYLRACRKLSPKSLELRSTSIERNSEVLRRKANAYGSVAGTWLLAHAQGVRREAPSRGVENRGAVHT